MDIEEMIADSEYASDSIPVAEHTAETNARIDALQTDVNELLNIVRPLVPIIAVMPEVVAKLIPFIEGLKNSPVLKMLGIKV